MGRMRSLVRHIVPLALPLVALRLSACGGEVALDDAQESAANLPSFDGTRFDAGSEGGSEDGTSPADAIREFSGDAAIESAVAQDTGLAALDSMGAVDAGDGEAAFDADLGDGACVPYYERCNGYAFEQCDGTGRWFRPPGYPHCCKDARFQSTANASVLDTKTGRTWWAYGNNDSTRAGANAACGASFAGGERPTTAELLDILIGVGDGGLTDCRPPVDHGMFPGAWGSLNWTQDGCIDFATGKVSGPECVDGPYGPPGFMCIRK